MRPETYRQRLKHKSTKELKKLATQYFNAYIRERDKNKPCISCGSYSNSYREAGHFYSAGKYQSLRYHPLNVHLQCKHCNRHLHGNLNEYRKNLEHRIGYEALKTLDFISGMEKQAGFHKLDRTTLIEIIMEYKYR